MPIPLLGLIPAAIGAAKKVVGLGVGAAKAIPRAIQAVKRVVTPPRPAPPAPIIRPATPAPPVPPLPLKQKIVQAVPPIAVGIGVAEFARRQREAATPSPPPEVLPTPSPTPTPASPVYTGVSVVDYLKNIGQPSDFASRARLAAQHGIANYTGTAEQNTRLLNILRENVPITPTPTPIPPPGQQQIIPTPDPQNLQERLKPVLEQGKQLDDISDLRRRFDEELGLARQQMLEAGERHEEIGEMILAGMQPRTPAEIMAEVQQIKDLTGLTNLRAKQDELSGRILGTEQQVRDEFGYERTGILYPESLIRAETARRLEPLAPQLEAITQQVATKEAMFKLVMDRFDLSRQEAEQRLGMYLDHTRQSWTMARQSFQDMYGEFRDILKDQEARVRQNMELGLQFPLAGIMPDDDPHVAYLKAMPFAGAEETLRFNERINQMNREQLEFVQTQTEIQRLHNERIARELGLQDLTEILAGDILKRGADGITDFNNRELVSRDDLPFVISSAQAQIRERLSNVDNAVKIFDERMAVKEREEQAFRDLPFENKFHEFMGHITPYVDEQTRFNIATRIEERHRAQMREVEQRPGLLRNIWDFLFPPSPQARTSLDQILGREPTKFFVEWMPTENEFPHGIDFWGRT